jgi:hypothetical protein
LRPSVRTEFSEAELQRFIVHVAKVPLLN